MSYPPTSEEILCENKHRYKLFGYYELSVNKCENDDNRLDNVTHWYKSVEIPKIQELRCMATEQAGINAEVDQIDYLERFIKASEYILSLLKPKD